MPKYEDDDTFLDDRRLAKREESSPRGYRSHRPDDRDETREDPRKRIYRYDKKSTPSELNFDKDYWQNRQKYGGKEFSDKRDLSPASFDKAQDKSHHKKITGRMSVAGGHRQRDEGGLENKERQRDLKKQEFDYVDHADPKNSRSYHSERDRQRR